MCHGGCGGGGIYDFERTMFSGGDPDSWWKEITRICGLEPNKRGIRDHGELIATYDYHDPAGKLLFQKLRYKPKNFSQRAPNGKGGWDYTLNGVPRLPYRLPELITARVVLIAEGEKDADNLNALPWGSLANGKPMPPVSATCNPEGAGPGKWRDSYSVYLKGRMVVIFPDNDAVGQVHASEVAHSVFPYAHSVKIVNLPDLPEHGDVSNYLENHSVGDLYALIRKTPQWVEEKVEEKPFFVPPSQILKGSVDVEWLVPGIIHRKSKGLIVASPKAGKSMIALDLAVALASSQSWLGQPLLNRNVRTAVVSREDGPGMTKKRIQGFAQARGLSMASLDQWLRFNTHEQKRSFSVESDVDIEEISRWIKQEGIEFCIFDVLNLLHDADENSNTEMTKVMKRFDKIRNDSGADIAIIHHDKKDSRLGSKKPRGASAIDSWWEWKVSISPREDDENVKDIYFGSKAVQAHPPVAIEFVTTSDSMMAIVPAVSR